MTLFSYSPFSLIKTIGLKIFTLICLLGIGVASIFAQEGNTNTVELVEVSMLSLQEKLFALSSGNLQTSIIVDIPMPGNCTVPFEISSSPIMSDKLAKKYPYIKSYSISSIEDKTTHGRLTLTHLGIHATILSLKGTIGIFPVQNSKNNTSHRITLGHSQEDISSRICGLEENPKSPEWKAHYARQKLMQQQKSFGFTSGDEVFTYDLAIIATGEFYEANLDASNGSANDDADVTAVITSVVDGIQVFFERDVAVRFNLLTPVLHDDPDTDPFTPNGEGGAERTSQARTQISAEFTNTEYDFGHVFHNHSEGDGWSSGGVAGLGVTCDNNNFFGDGPQKAGGWSGSFNNQNTAFIGLAAHEFGHQFDAAHSFNGTGASCTNAISSTSAYEIASGVTIMSYNGICSDDQNIPISGTAHDYFHTHSLTQMINYINNDGDCVTGVSNGNTPPTVDANSCGGTHTIPISTPFELIGTGSDADGDAITYTWEQYDEDGAGSPTQGDVGADAADNGDGTPTPLFRNYPPTTSSSRTIPPIEEIIAAANPDTIFKFEALPTVTRTLNFRLTARDNNPNGGGVTCDDLVINVDAGGGAFSVTSPNTGSESWAAGSTQTVTWNEGDTEIAPINCATVTIRLSIDGGLTYPYILESDVTNDGSQDVTIPAGVLDVSTARIKVECSSNTCVRFFDISNNDFDITSDCMVQLSYICPTDEVTGDSGDTAFNLNLSNYYTLGIENSPSFDIVAADPNANLRIAASSGSTTCSNSSFNDDYQLFSFIVAESGVYTLSGFLSNGVAVGSLFEADGFSPTANCASNSTFYGSSANGAGGSIVFESSFSADLEACFEYTLIIYENGPATVDVFIGGPGDVIQTTTAPGANYAYTYVAVNQSDNLIDAVSSSANFTNLNSGTFDVHGVSYKGSGGGSPDDVDPDTFIGQSLSTILSGGDCAVFSDNTKQLNVNAGACNLSPTITGNMPFCDGESIVLDAGEYEPTPNTYNWSSGQTTRMITITEGGVYTVTVTDNTGTCSNTASVTAIENPTPNPSITGDLAICPDETTTLDAGSFGFNVSYLWSNNNEVTQTISVSATGNYFVTVTSDDNCSGVASTEVIDQTVGCPAEDCTELFISEYVEGNLNNQCLEIYNPTGSSVDLTANTYQIRMYDAGSSTISATVNLTGTIASQAVYTICNQLETLTSVTADQTDNNLVFSGDDAVTLAKDGTNIDVIGQIGFDPGTEWGTGNASTSNNTLRRKAAILTGDTDGSNAFDPSIEWDGFANENIDDFGSHTNDCGVCTPYSVSITGDLAYCSNDGNTILDAGTYNQYMWSNGANTQTIEATAGDYFVTVTDGSNCTGTASAVVTENPNPTPTISGDLAYCSEDGSTTLDAGSYDSYLWSNDEITQMITATEGDYFVTVTSNGCTGTASAAVSENANPTPTITGALDYCANDGSITLDAGSYDSYLWSNDETTQMITATEGDYFVTVTSNGCTGTASAAVTENPSPAPAITGDLEICPDETTILDAGTFGFNVSYLWSNNNEITQNISVSNTGTYTVTVTSDDNCSGTDSVQVIEATGCAVDDCAELFFSEYIEGGSNNKCMEIYNPTANTVDLSAGDYQIETYVNGDLIPDNIVDLTGTVASGDVYIVCNGSATSTFTGEADQTTPQSGPASLSHNGNDVIALTKGGTNIDVFGEIGTSTNFAANITYVRKTTILVGDSNGNDAFDPNIEWDDFPQDNADDLGSHTSDCNNCTPYTPTITGDLAYCSDEISTVLDAGMYDSYIWSSGEMTQTIEAIAGDYFVTVTDASNCTGTGSVSVTENTNPTPTITGDLAYCSDEISTVLDAGIYAEYIWSSGEMTRTIAAMGGTYTVTVTNASDCTGTDNVEVTENANPTPNISGSLTYCTGGSTTLDAGMYDSYIWSSGEMTRTIEATEGDYTVTVTNASNCTGTDNVSVSENSNLMPMITGDLTYCTGGSTTLDAGMYSSYVWSDNSTNRTITVTAGVYTVTVTGDGGCTGTDSVEVSENSNLTPTITGELAYCSEEGNTVLDAGMYDGYAWSSGEMTRTIAATEGNYTVTVTGDGGCTGTDNVSVTENTSPTPVITGDLDYCESEGNVVLDAGMYDSYIWSSGEMTRTIAAMDGTYTVTVTGDGGCTGTDSVEVSENANPMPMITGDLTYCTGGSTTLDAGMYSSYVWSDNSTNRTITVTAGVYTVTVTGDGGCTGTDSVEVSENSNLTPTITGELAYCSEEENTILDAGMYDGYAWSSGEITRTIAATEGDYTVTVTGDGGCTGTDNVSVTENASPTPVITGDLDYCESEGNVVLDAGLYDSYIWSSGEMTRTIAAMDGTYTVTVTGDGGCTGTDSVEVSENANPMPMITGDLTYCTGGSTTLDAGMYSSYVWSDNSTNRTITVTAGVYTVTVTGDGGCTGTDSVEVSENSNLTPTITGELAYCSEEENTVLDAGMYDGYAWSSGEITRTIAATEGDYTVTVTGDGGCTGTDNVSVTENTSPTPIIAGDFNYCEGENGVVLDAGMYDGYIWSSGEMSRTIAAIAGTYTVTVTGDGGCTGTDSVEVSENANPTPTIAGDLTYCTGESTLLDAGIYDGYVWSSGEMTRTIEATEGEYFVTVTADGGCMGTASVSVTENNSIEVSIMSTFNACVDEDAILDAGSYTDNDMYQWSSNQDTQVIEVSTGGIYTVTVTTGSGCSGTATTEVIDVCDAFVSGLNHNGETLCSGGEITASVDNVQTLDGYDLLYVLFEVDNQGETTFEAQNDTGTFSVGPGDYQICAYVELRDCAPDPSPFVETLDNLDEVGTIEEGCYDYVCSDLTMPEALDTFGGTGQASEDNAAGNNIFIAEVCGGEQPYEVDFTSSPSSAFASVTGPFSSPNTGCVQYRVEYVDDAEWTLIITDDNGCTNSDVTFTSDGIPSNPLPQIDGILTTPVTCSGGSYNEDGTFTATISGGDNSCDDYTYSATSTNGYSQTGTFASPPDDGTSELALVDLAHGTYDITVTDCAGTTTVGTKKVNKVAGRSRRGGCRGTIQKGTYETDLLEEWKVYPNPFTQQTTMEFTLVEDAHITANIYSIEGRRVAEVFNGTATANTLYQMSIDASGLPIGVYILQFAMENGDVHHEKLYIRK